MVKTSLLIFSGLLLVSVLPILVYADPPISHDVGTYEIHDFYVIGLEEYIVCEGEIHYNIQLVLDSGGGAHWRSCASHNLLGAGLTTGKKYQVVSTETRHYDGETRHSLSRNIPVNRNIKNNIDALWIVDVFMIYFVSFSINYAQSPRASMS